MSKTYSFGKNIKVEIRGASHESAISAVIRSLPSGTLVDADTLSEFLKRRAPGKSKLVSQRREPDIPEIRQLSGDGTSYEIIIANTDVKSPDYDATATMPRPGHADYTSYVKYGEIYPGGGAFSGRMTAAVCAAGGIALQILKSKGITVGSHVFSIADNYDEPFDPANICGSCLERLSAEDFPVNSPAAGEKMRAAVRAAKEAGDSLGGIIEVAATGFPAGAGGPLFDGLESRLSESFFAIPAVKGVEFGTGFAATVLKGSENNDPFAVKDGKVVTVSNHHGGILGGISSGMPLIARIAFKPTPSIGLPQTSVNLETLETQTITIEGRHDPCIVMRAAPVCEAAMALGLLDALMETGGDEGGLDEIRKGIDDVDDQIAKLFAKRMALALSASRCKRDAGLPVKNEKREKELLDRISASSDAPLEGYTRELFEKLISLSCDYQNSCRKEEEK